MTEEKLHLSSALRTLHGFLAPYAEDGVAIEPLALGMVLSLLESAAEEAAALEVLAMNKVAPMLAPASNVLLFRPFSDVPVTRGAPEGGAA